MMLRLEDLTECQQCGIVFNYIHNTSKINGVWISTCPVCKHEHELPKDCDHTYVYVEDKVGYKYEECSKCGKIK